MLLTSMTLQMVLAQTLHAYEFLALFEGITCWGSIM